MARTVRVRESGVCWREDKKTKGQRGAQSARTEGEGTRQKERKKERKGRLSSKRRREEGEGMKGARKDKGKKRKGVGARARKKGKERRVNEP